MAVSADAELFGSRHQRSGSLHQVPLKAGQAAYVCDGCLSLIFASHRQGSLLLRHMTVSTATFILIA